MSTLRKFEIPEYLKQGELYRTLMENNDDPNEEVTVPVNVLKPNIQIGSLVDCDQLLNSLRFWGVDGIGTKEIIAYVLTCHDQRQKVITSLKKYETEFQCIYWLRKVMSTREYDRSWVAIKSGLIELVEPVFVSRHIDKKQRLPVDACDLAAEVGNLEVMQFLCKNGCQINYTIGITAARHGHTSILQFLTQHGQKIGVLELSAATEGGHLQCVQAICALISSDWPSELLNRYKQSTYACDTAARHQHVDILQYLHSAGFSWGVHTTMVAAEGGHLPFLQYLHEHGCPWTSYTCATAARNGNLHCLQYAHQHGCPIDNNTAASAVEGNHLDCLQYAHEHGCTWTNEQSEGTERVRFAVNGTTELKRIRRSSPLVWDYLRKHSINT